jgi:hypothetical protein
VEKCKQFKLCLTVFISYVGMLNSLTTNGCFNNKAGVILKFLQNKKRPPIAVKTYILVLLKKGLKY